MPIDEFGLHQGKSGQEEEQQQLPEALPTLHEERKPVLQPLPDKGDPSKYHIRVAPFIDMPQQPEEKEAHGDNGTGCCSSCIIM